MPMMSESQQQTTSIQSSTLNIEPDSSTNPNQMDSEDSSTVVAVENASPEVIHVVSMTSAPTSATQVQPQQVHLFSVEMMTPISYWKGILTTNSHPKVRLWGCKKLKNWATSWSRSAAIKSVNHGHEDWLSVSFTSVADGAYGGKLCQYWWWAECADNNHCSWKPTNSFVNFNFTRGQYTYFRCDFLDSKMRSRENEYCINCEGHLWKLTSFRSRQ